MMKVGLIWYFTVIANCVSIKYAKVNTVTFHGNPNANTANAYDYIEMRRDSRKSENFRNIVRRSVKRQRYDQFMADMIAKHHKAVAVTISLSAIVTIVIITIAVANRQLTIMDTDDNEHKYRQQTRFCPKRINKQITSNPLIR
ncbi:Queuine tRNA-ribosyltransferase catalytic subunit [Dirofilaria immitis]